MNISALFFAISTTPPRNVPVTELFDIPLASQHRIELFQVLTALQMYPVHFSLILNASSVSGPGRYFEHQIPAA